MQESTTKPHIYWRNGVAYGYAYRQGREHRRSLRTRDPQEAEGEFKRWLESLEPKVCTAAGQPTFKEAVIAWRGLVYEAPIGEGLKQSSRDRILDCIRIMSSMFAEATLEEINHKAIGRWVMARREGKVVHNGVKLKPSTNATIRRELSALSSVFTAVNALGIYDQNPAATWNRRVIPETRAPFYVPTVAEIELVASHASPEFAALIRFAAYTGCRQGEAVDLTWRDVRLERREVRFFHTKTSQPRVIALKSPGGDATASVTGRPRHIGVPLVFWHTLGQRYMGVPNNFARLVQKAIKAEKEAGRALKAFNFHKMRHAFAIRWLENGGDIYELSKHLGHTSVKTTEIYLAYVKKGYGGHGEWDEAEVAAEAEGARKVS
jgi:integrase